MLKQTIILNLVFFSLCSLSNAQDTDFTIPLSKPGEQGTLTIDINYGSIRVSGYDGAEVIVRFPKNKSASTEFVFDFYEENNNVIVLKKSSKQIKNIELDIQVPSNFSVNLDSNFGNFIEVLNLKGDVYAHDHFGDVRLKNIEGNVKLESQTGNIEVIGLHGNLEASTFGGNIDVSDFKGSAILDNNQGDINARFTSIPDEYPLAMSNLKGKIDITLPADIKASLKISSFSAKISSDFVLKPWITKEVLKKKNRRIIYRTINGGGVPIQLKNHQGKIHIRADK